METLIDYCKRQIKDRIHNFVGSMFYGCDFANELTMAENCDGSCTYNAQDAREYIHEWYEDAAEYWDYENDNFGSHQHNPFDNPEAYMVCMFITASDRLLAQCETIDDNWNERFELTDELADKIVSELDMVETIGW